MKIEIEVKEDEIKDAIERHIRVAVAKYTETFAAQEYIKSMVKELWKESADKVVKEVFADLPAIRTKAEQALQTKVLNQLNALIRKKGGL